MSAWMISGAVLSDFIPPPDSGAVLPGTSGWEEGNLLLPKDFHFQNLSSRVLKLESLVIILGHWEKQPQLLAWV